MRLRPETSPEVEKATKEEKGKHHATDDDTFNQPLPTIEEQMGA